jgi:hypothetical protein
MIDALLAQNAEAVLHRGRGASFATVSPEVWATSKHDLEELLGALTEAKCTAVNQGDEDSANETLAIILAVRGALSELEVWSFLAKGQWTEAWDSLVAAQNLAAAAMRAHAFGARYERDLNTRLAMQVVLFPPQTFMSAGMIVRRAECSICGRDYDECDHVKGVAYMGAMCVRTIHDGQLLEASIVDEPSDKRCRVIALDGIDRFTLEPAGESSDAG